MIVSSFLLQKCVLSYFNSCIHFLYNSFTFKNVKYIMFSNLKIQKNYNSTYFSNIVKFHTQLFNIKYFDKVFQLKSLLLKTRMRLYLNNLSLFKELQFIIKYFHIIIITLPGLLNFQTTSWKWEGKQNLNQCEKRWTKRLTRNNARNHHVCLSAWKLRGEEARDVY